MKYTLQELMDMKGTSEPVRHALQAMADEIEALRQAAKSVLDAHRKTMAWFGDQMRKQGITSMTVNDVQAAELAAIRKLAEVLKPHNAH